MKSSKRKICQAVVLAFSAMAASAAMAQTVPNILGGGSSLIAPTINAEIHDFGTNIGNMTYETFSSGVGQSAFLNNDPTQFSLSATDGPVNFANSDAALTTLQVSTAGTYARSGTDGILLQLPYAVTPITIPYTQAPADVPATLVLNDFDLCGIFSGKITTWNLIQNPDNNNAPYTASTASIKVAYRSDNSGTSDLLTRHLQAVCTTGTNGNSNVAFTESQSFASNFGGSIPASFISASGSGGVASVVVGAKTGTTGTVFAYLSPDYTNTTLAPQSSSASANQLTVASLRNSAGADVAPTGAEATLALGGVTPPASTAPRATVINPFNWVPGAVLGSTQWAAVANPASGYPISGTTNIIVSQCYANSASVTAVTDFLNDHYNNSTFQGVLAGNGFATVPATYVTAITNDFLTSNTLHTNIGNTSANACGAAGIVGR